MKNMHTPTPWKWDGNVWDYDSEQEAPWIIADGKDIPGILTGEIKCPKKEDAEFIITAVNAYDAQREMIAELVAVLKRNITGNCCNCETDYLCDKCAAEEFIAKAEKLL